MAALLGHLDHLVDGGVHLIEAGGLLLGGGGDLDHEVADVGYLHDDAAQRLTRLTNQVDARPHMPGRG